MVRYTVCDIDFGKQGVISGSIFRQTVRSAVAHSPYFIIIYYWTFIGWSLASIYDLGGILIYLRSYISAVDLPTVLYYILRCVLCPCAGGHKHSVDSMSSLQMASALQPADSEHYIEIIDQVMVMDIGTLVVVGINYYNFILSRIGLLYDFVYHAVLLWPLTLLCVFLFPYSECPKYISSS